VRIALGGIPKTLRREPFAVIPGMPGKFNMAFSAVGNQTYPASQTRELRITSRWHRAALLVLTIELFFGPLAFGGVQPWAEAIMLLLSLLALQFWMLGNLDRGRIDFSFSPLYLPCGLFLAIGLFQYFLHETPDPYSTRQAVLAFAAALLAFFLARELFTILGEQALRRLAYRVVIFATAMGIFAILQFYSGNSRIYWIVESSGWTFGSYVNHNQYAGLMEMLLPLGGIYVLSLRSDDVWRWLLGIALLFPTASLLLSASRGGFVSMLAEIVIFFGVALYARKSRSKLGSWTGLLLLGLCAVALLFFWLDPGRVSSRLAAVISIGHSKEALVADRLSAARDALRMLKDHPLFGVGLGAFRVTFPRYQSRVFDSYWGYAHNDYAQALAETGIAGGILVLAAVCTFFVELWKGLLRHIQTRRAPLHFGAALGCCGILIHSFVDFNLHVPANALWFAICAAIATLPNQPARTEVSFARYERVPEIAAKDAPRELPE
jgi:O-antigen ligase